MTALLCAKAAAVTSVFYFGVNVYQLLAKLDDVRARARQFAAVAGDGANAARLRAVRMFFYFGAPMAYLGMLLGAAMPTAFLIAAASKFWVSALLGLGIEQRILRGVEYSGWNHRLSRLDAILNLALAGGVIWLVLRHRY